MININPSVWLYTLPFFAVARGSSAITRCIFRRDVVVSPYTFLVSDIHDLSRSRYRIDERYGTPAGQVPVHLARIHDEQRPLSSDFRAVGMTMHQQVEGTARGKRLQQLLVIAEA
jgi:hypothetical protein